MAWTKIDESFDRDFIAANGRSMVAVQRTGGNDACRSESGVYEVQVDIDGDKRPDQIAEFTAHIAWPACDQYLNVAWFRVFNDRYGQALLSETKPAIEPLPSKNTWTLGFQVFAGQFLGNGAEQVAIIDSYGQVNVFEWNPFEAPLF